jgi:twitching motility protein PilT
VNFSYEKNNVMIVARVIDDKIMTLEEIGMPPVVAELLDLPQGFILVTGPTGCGKSTTLAAMISRINENRNANIISLEDPIEYIFTPDKSIISQRQLGTDMLTFSSGLKHVLRQDPNIIMLGEMRDLETISTAVTLAETGHLVLATLHTYSAAQTIDRIIDTFPPYQQNQVKLQLSAVLTAVISQRLLPKTGGGRVAAREILLNNEAVANLIREGKLAQIKTTIETNAKSGMVTLDRHISQLYQAGTISRETAERNMEDTRMLES